MRVSTPIRALLCDLDGVLRHRNDLFAAFAQTESENDLPVQAIERAVFGHVDLERVITGRLSHDEWITRMAKRFAASWGATVADSFVQNWNNHPGTVDTFVYSLLKQAQRAGITTALVTNGTTRLQHDLRILGVSPAIDAVFNSADIGIAKPDRTFFAWAAKALGFQPSNCLLLDDNGENVDSARALGMSTVLFDQSERSRLLATAAVQDSHRFLRF